MITLDHEVWQRREAEHVERAQRLTQARRERTAQGRTHAVDDFLFTYYPLKPALLARWSPGAGIALADARGSRFEEARWFDMHDGAAHLDVAAYLSDRGSAVRFHHTLLSAIDSRPPRFDCFGLHEWAMVYGEAAGQHRHDLPLRLSEAETDAVVTSHKIVCSHIDAFRFFTPPAVGFNTMTPTRETQVEMDQGGCLHVGMDLVKTTIHLGPAVPGDLALDVVELARDIRELDMRASPYDVSRYGLSAVTIETADGKAEYVAAQRALSQRAEPLRARLRDVCAGLLTDSSLASALSRS